MLEKGATVYAVEPNDDMRKVAENNLSKFSKFIPVKGTAESTTLSDNSIEIITVAQAFHWFDRQKFKKECQRILKPSGKVILIWNFCDSRSELVIENESINRKYCPNFKGFSGGIREVTQENDFSDFFSGEYTVRVFPNPLSFSKESFVGRNLSASYALKENDVNYTAYINEMEKLFDKHSKNGTVTMPNFTRSYIGTI